MTRQHHQRLREVYRSSGWPCHDMLEVALLARGLLERHFDTDGRESLRVTDAGLLQLAQAHAGNQASRSAHELLVERVCGEMARAGRLVWRGLTLRAPVALPEASAGVRAAGEMTRDVGCDPDREMDREMKCEMERGQGNEKHPQHALVNSSQAGASQANSQQANAPKTAQAMASIITWAMACPDVFSIRHTSVEAYLEPIVHEIKVSRADLLGDLKKPNKRAAYLGLGGECWYVLGQDAKGRPIGQPQEIPAECGVMLCEGDQGERLVVARPAPHRPMARMPFHIWMALARAAPAMRPDTAGQALL